MAVLGTGASGEDVAADLAPSVARVFLVGRAHGFSDGASPFGFDGWVGGWVGGWAGLRGGGGVCRWWIGGLVGEWVCRW